MKDRVKKLLLFTWVIMAVVFCVELWFYTGRYQEIERKDYPEYSYTVIVEFNERDCAAKITRDNYEQEDTEYTYHCVMVSVRENETIYYFHNVWGDRFEIVHKDGEWFYND